MKKINQIDEQGLKQGPWRTKIIIIREDNYKNGELHGISRQFRNGILDNESNYENGKLHGMYRSFYENGELYGISKYINGKEYSSKYFNKDGKLCMEKTEDEKFKISKFISHYTDNPLPHLPPSTESFFIKHFPDLEQLEGENITYEY